MVDVPISLDKRKKFKREILGNPKLFAKVIDLIMNIDAQTISC